MGYSKAFLANANVVKHTPKVTGHVGTPRNVSGKI